MKISYAITVCNEYDEIQRLIPLLLENKRKQDEIVVLFDQKNGDEKVAEYLTTFSKYPNFQFWRDYFEGHFADWKNKLTEYCDGDYIFQIDADEYPNKMMFTHLPAILETNPNNEVYLVPRVNTVEGLTQEHINKWGWKVDSNNRVNWPDYQWRVWKNKPEIKWINKVHEVLNGYKTYAALPEMEALALYHPKDIVRQEKQNDYYDTL
ncbi:glycosyltransferase [bacterium]|nr:glycosyltransferase [bacterium]|tara:strand:- start:95 stop:718 length:624 start_codon:yes stop_codon:yes gene_type:complete